MELTFQWFWLVQLVLFLAVAYSIYRSYKAEFKSKKWHIIVAILLILGIVQPIKMEQSNLGVVHQQETSNIEQSKALPEMVVDTSFKEAVKAKKEITKEELK